MLRLPENITNIPPPQFKLKTRFCRRGFRSQKALAARRKRNSEHRERNRNRRKPKSSSSIGSKLRSRNRVSDGDSILSPPAKRPSAPNSIATFNSRTLKCPWRQKELATLTSKLNILFVAVQEHRIVHDDPIRYVDLDNKCTFITSSAECYGVGGVGFMCNPCVDVRYIRVKSHSSRILELTVKLFDRIVHVFSVYSPTAVRTIEASVFYAHLSSILVNIPSRDTIMLCGDFNACYPLSLYPVGRNFNANSPHLIDLINLYDLTPLNSVYRKPMSRRATFHGPNGRKERLDHILTNCPRLFYDCDTISPFAISSDHLLVFSCMKQRLRYCKGKAGSSLSWQSLPECSQAFNDCLGNSFVGRPPLGDFSILSSSVIKAAETVLPRKKRQWSRVSWDNDAKIKQVRDELKLAKKQLRDCSPDTHDVTLLQSVVNQKTTDLAAAHNALIERESSAIISAVKAASNSNKHCIAWKEIRRLKNSSHKPLLVEAYDSVEANRLIRTYFYDLYNPPSSVGSVEKLVAPPNFSPPDISEYNISPVTNDELCSILFSMKPLAAPGPDGIPTLALREPLVQHELLTIINSVLSGDQEVPGQWRRSAVITVNKNSSRDLDQQRGITLSSTAGKANNKILHKRLASVIDPHLRYNQNGGRNSRSTIGQILSARILLEGCRTHQKDIVVIFIDFKKAFDSVLRCRIPELLAFYNVPDVLINAIMSFYSSTSAFVRTHYGETDDFSTACGVLQGDTLSPFLFTLFIDYVFRIICPDLSGFTLDRRRSTRHSEKCVSDLSFVDDIAILTNSISEAQKTLDEVERVCLTVGLTINTTKTKFIALGIEQAHLSTSNGDIERVDSFKYLGSVLPSSSDDLNNRRGQAWAAIRGLNKIWASDVSTDVKLQLFRHTIEPVLLYASETWVLSNTLSTRLDSAYDAMLRHALGSHWPNVLPTAQLRKLSPSGSAISRQRQMSFFGHIERSKTYAPQPLHDILHWQPKEKFRRGYGQVVSHGNVLCNELSFLKVSLSAMSDRDVWRTLCSKYIRRKRDGTFL